VDLFATNKKVSQKRYFEAWRRKSRGFGFTQTLIQIQTQSLTNLVILGKIHNVHGIQLFIYKVDIISPES
jgi:hypothetical protein